MKLDSATIVTALLHDVVEDSAYTLDDIKQNFGIEISKLVDGVTKLSKLETRFGLAQAENFRKLLLASSDDIRVLLVKLADRLHNIRTINGIKNNQKRSKICYETLEIFAPLAERLGIVGIQRELEDRCFAEIKPETRNSILKRLDFIYSQDKINIPFITKEIESFFKKNNEQFKVELVNVIPEEETVTFYRQGDFVDLCRGPHAPSTKKLGHSFKLTKLAGSYWRGDSNNPVLLSLIHI